MTKTYSETLEEHIKFLQGELDKAAALAHKYEGIPQWDQIGGNIFQQYELVKKWGPMTKHIKNPVKEFKCAQHLEYAMQYIVKLYGDNPKHAATPIVIPCIARMYD